MPAINIDKEASDIMNEFKKFGQTKKTLVSFLIKKYARDHVNFKEEKISS